MLVGEQPGDREDIEGHPFVGPAGHVLDVALERAGLDDARIYKTNAVKHFRFKVRGKRRLHEPPLRSHVVACQPWLRAEIEILAPPLLVLLGAVAAQSLLGRDFKVTRQRGLVSEPPAGLPDSSRRCIRRRSCAHPTTSGKRAWTSSWPISELAAAEVRLTPARCPS